MFRRLAKLLQWRRKRLLSKGLVTNTKNRIRQLFIMVLAIILLHTIAMVVFEKLSFGDALWLSLTTINTTGYGDLSSSTFVGRSFTVILMYVLGITIMAQLATEYIEYRIERKDRKIKGFWNWNIMNQHIVIINTPQHNPELYLERLCGQLRNTPAFSETPICILSDKFQDGLPVTLTDQNVVYVHGDARDPMVLDRANVDEASHIILISPNSALTSSDSVTLDVLFHLKDRNLIGKIIAEAVKDENRKRFSDIGASAVMRPIRAYPELMVRALEAPGTEQFMENLFGHDGDRPVRYDHSFKVSQWANLACSIMQKGLGTPVGFIDSTGDVHTNPAPLKPAVGEAILLLVHHEHIPDKNHVIEAIESVSKEVENA
ncbi:potassium channel family protein [Pleionea sediminis]|uniref:potassium channel family protein n=1 Tax=Pleionea sediminis TaxID=2569479 RepID=UPI0011848D4B|nr:potassium channel family protein [Pleionea sediminis]